MRIPVMLTAVVLAFIVSSTASAQFGLSTSNRAQPPRGRNAGLFNSTGLLSSPFRLTDLFAPSRNTLVPAPRQQTVFPNPNSPDYLKGFGFRRL